MTLASSLLPALTAARAIAGQLGLRPYTVAVIVTARAGSYGLEGAATATTTSVYELGGQPPKVRHLNDEERALGNLGSGSVEIGPITPSHAGGGITLSALTGGAMSAGQVLHYRLTGPSYPAGQLFRVVDSNADSALHYTVKLEPVSAS